MQFQEELIDKKAEEWLNRPDLDLTDLDNNKSIKSNFMLCARNFLNIKKWANGLLAYIRYLRKLIDIENIIAEVQIKLRTQKLYFPIAHKRESNEIIHTDPVTGYNYLIKYNSDTEIEITPLTDDNFVTDQMIVTVKNAEGFIVYPVIQTGGKTIKIFFADEISTNYIVYVL